MGRAPCIRQPDTWSAIKSNCFLATILPHVTESVVPMQVCRVWCPKGISSLYSMFLAALVPSLPPLWCMASTTTWLHAVKANVLFVFLCRSTVWWFHVVEHNLFSDPFTPSASSIAFKSDRLFHVFIFFILHVSDQPQAKGNPLSMLATGLLQDGIIPSPLLFLVFSFFWALINREVYMDLSLDQFLDASSAKELHPQFWIPSFYPPSFISLFWSLYFRSPCTPPPTTTHPTTTTALPSLIKPMPQSSSSVVFLVFVQVSHRTDQWGRCRCKWISSLTLAQESTKSAWRVRLYCFIKDTTLKIALIAPNQETKILTFGYVYFAASHVTVQIQWFSTMRWSGLECYLNGGAVATANCKLCTLMYSCILVYLCACGWGSVLVGLCHSTTWTNDRNTVWISTNDRYIYIISVQYICIRGITSHIILLPCKPVCCNQC